MRKKISVVIPTYNEEANVIPLADAIVGVLTGELAEYDYEIIFIDNHSKDSTQMKLRSCAGRIKESRPFSMPGISARCAPRYTA